MSSLPRFPGAPRGALAAASLALSLATLLAGCATQRRTTCGDPSPRGGPPVISTRDGELCESARLRVAEALARRTKLFAETAELYRDYTWSWEDAKSLEGFLRRVRADAGDDLADAVATAIEQVRTHASKPMPADCADAERCLVRGAALGCRIAFDDVAGVLRMLRKAAGGATAEPVTPQ